MKGTEPDKPICVRVQDWIIIPMSGQMHRENMKKRNCICILLFAWILFAVSGCEAGPEIKESSADPVEQSAQIVQEEVDTPPDEFVYTFDPHVISDEYRTIFGDEFSGEFFSFRDVILGKGKEFPCTSRERFYQLLSVSNSCFPLAPELISKEETTVRDGICHLVYRYNDGELDERILSFENKVTAFMNAAVPYDEPDPIKAMELFTAVANKDTYDDAYTLEDSLKLRSYRSIMEDTGICQEIAAEYIYYLLQAGIDAVPCSSLNADQSEAHEWVMVKLNGSYYHMDPTYALNYPDSLYFFGMDDIQREYYGNFPKGNYTYASSDVLSECAAADRTFEIVWLAETYVIDHEGRKIIITETGTGKECEYDFKDLQ